KTPYWRSWPVSCRRNSHSTFSRPWSTGAATRNSSATTRTAGNCIWTKDSRNKIMLKLSTPVQYIKGVGPRRGEALNGEGILTAEDLLYYKPFRYEDRTRFKSIGSLRDGEFVVICGRIVVAGLYATTKSGFKIYELNVRDETGSVNVKFFNQPYLKNV